MDNAEKYQKALAAINELFNDQSVTIEKAIENLEELMGEIEILLDALNSDLKVQKRN